MVTGTSIQGSKDSLRLARLNPGVLYATSGEAFILIIAPYEQTVCFKKAKKAMTHVLNENF